LSLSVELGRFAPLAIAFTLAVVGGAWLSGAPRPSPSPSPAATPSVAPEPWPDAPPDPIERGRALFHDRAKTSCTSCHDDEGAGNGPSLLGLADRYLERLKNHAAAADYLRHHIRDPQNYPGFTGRVWNVQMMPFRPEALSDAELADLIEFLLSRRGRRPVSGAGAASASRGGEVADRLKCTSCHSTAKGTSLLGLFDRWKRAKGSSAAARAALSQKLATHPEPTAPEDVRDLVEFLKQAK
jgi:cytochrome c551/c552